MGDKNKNMELGNKDGDNSTKISESDNIIHNIDDIDNINSENNNNNNNNNNESIQTSDNPDDIEQKKFFQQKLETIIKQYVKIIEITDAKENLVPSFIISISKTNDLNELNQMKNQLNQLGFVFDISITTKINQKSRKKLDEIHYKLDFRPISLNKFQKLNKTLSRTIYDKPKKFLDKKRISISLLSLLGVILFLYNQIYTLTINDEYESSLLNAFGTTEESTIITNILYFTFGFISIILVREITYYIVSKSNKIRYELPYFASLDSISNRKTNPNILFDLSSARIYSGFLCSLLLLIFGLSLSEVFLTENLDLNNDLDESINRYNLLVQILKKIFYPESNNIIEIFYGYDNQYSVLMPERTILMHPLAYAGEMGLILTLFSIIPFIYTDGGKIYYTIFRNNYGNYIGGIIFGISIMLILTENLFIAFYLFFSGFAIKINNSYEIEDLKFDFYPLSEGRKRSIILLIIILVLIIPITGFENYFGYLY